MAAESRGACDPSHNAGFDGLHGVSRCGNRENDGLGERRPPTKYICSLLQLSSLLAGNLKIAVVWPYHGREPQRRASFAVLRPRNDRGSVKLRNFHLTQKPANWRWGVHIIRRNPRTIMLIYPYPAGERASKLSSSDIDEGRATPRGTGQGSKIDWIVRKCRKDADFSIPKFEKFTEINYTKFVEVNRLYPGRRSAARCTEDPNRDDIWCEGQKLWVRLFRPLEVFRRSMDEIQLGDWWPK